MRVTDGQRGQMLTLRRGRGGPKVTPGANLMSVDGPGVGVVRQGVMTRGTRRPIATSAKRRQEDQRPVRIIPIPARITPSAGSGPATLKMALPRPKSTRKTASVGPWVPCCGPDWTRAKKTVTESLIALAPSDIRTPSRSDIASLQTPLLTSTADVTRFDRHQKVLLHLPDHTWLPTGGEALQRTGPGGVLW